MARVLSLVPARANHFGDDRWQVMTTSPPPWIGTEKTA